MSAATATRSAGLAAAGPAVAAAAAAAAALTRPALALAAVGGIAVVLLLAANVAAVPYFLVFTMFVESVELGSGLRIGRVAGGLALLVIVYVVIRRGANGLRPNALLAVAGGFGLWMLASMLWAGDPSYTTPLLFSYLLAAAYMLAFALLVRTEAQLRGLLATFALGSILFGLVSIAAYATGAAAADEGRAAGLQGDPNYFAVYQVVSLPAVLVLAALERRQPVRLALYAAVGVIVISVASSLSRTGLVALGIVVLLTLVAPARIFFRRPGAKAAYVALLVAASAGAVALGSANLVERVQSALEPAGPGDRGSGRTDLWRAAWTGYTDANPALGLGAGNFKAQSLQLLQTTPGVDTTRNYVAADREAHNAYIGTLADLGLVGLTLFVLLIVLAGVYLVRAGRRARSRGSPVFMRFSYALAVALAGFAASAFFLSNELGKPLWIVVGLALALDATTRRLPVPAPGAGPDAEYDLAVQERLVDGLEQRVAQRIEALLAEQERLDRRRAALAVREQELRDRQRALDEAERTREESLSSLLALEARLEEREESLRRVEERLAQREAAVEERASLIDQAERGDVAERLRLAEDALARVAEQTHALAQRQAELDERAQQLGGLEARAAELDRREAELRALAAGAELDDRRSEELERRGIELAARLAEREEELERRAHELAARESTLAAQGSQTGSASERELARMRADAAELVERAQAQAAAYAEREEALARREEAFAERLDALTKRERALARGVAEAARAQREAEDAVRTRREPEAVVPEPPAPPPPVAAPPASAPPPAVAPAPVPALDPFAPQLDTLERLVDLHAAEYPERADEWRWTLLSLRDYASADGVLPPEFTGLVEDVFAPLLER